MTITLTQDEVYKIVEKHAQTMNLGKPTVSLINKRNGVQASISFEDNSDINEPSRDVEKHEPQTESKDSAPKQV